MRNTSTRYATDLKDCIQNCQDYLRTFASSITPFLLSTLSPPTEVIIIGCGQPDLIPMYTRETACPFPIYADPTRQLYHKLRMTATLALGAKSPEYMQRSMLSVVLQSFVQELRSGRKMLRGGDFRQVGGEFLFDGGKVVWCHRMRNTRDHAEMGVVKRELGLDGQGSEKEAVRKRWSSAGLGKGLELGRRLSQRRKSWGGSRSRSRNTEKEKGIEVHMRGVEEEKDDMPEDALRKSEGNGAVETEKRLDGVANGAVKDEAKWPVEALTNGPAKGHVTASAY